MHIVTHKLITFTEYLLTKRKRSRYIKKEKLKKINPLVDWLGAFLWAAGVVFLVNQILFQAYVIPSKSMENTLMVGDRILVNKFKYGPELLPGFFKISSNSKPEATQVIIFENPEYRSKGTFFDLISRIIFMLTLSIVDLDKDYNGNPAHHFLIKRSIASKGSIIRFVNGEVYVKSPGEDSFILESEYKNNFSFDYPNKRNINTEEYTDVDEQIRSEVYKNQNNMTSVYYKDLYFNSESNYKYLSHISPSMLEYYSQYNKKEMGHYIPPNWILPLGDNRDNSKDGRYFGIIHNSEVLGMATYKFWPIKRIGIIR